jgi:predicted glycosyltransferase
MLAFQPELYVFTGPFLDPGKYAELSAMSTARIHVHRYTNRFLDYLQAADLSISMAGYNTCMNLLSTRVPALVYPYARQQEQPIRAETIKKLAPIRVLGDTDIDRGRLCVHIEKVLNGITSRMNADLNLNGAQNARRFLHKWMQEPASRMDAG